MSGNNILCMYCESHHHVSEHDQCQREYLDKSVSSDYHYRLGQELAKLIDEWANDPDSKEYRGHVLLWDHSEEIQIDGELDFVQLGHWMTEAMSIVSREMKDA